MAWLGPADDEEGTNQEGGTRYHMKSFSLQQTLTDVRLEEGDKVQRSGEE